MVGCAAVGCTNNSTKGFLLKAFPRDPIRRQQWADNVKRNNWTPTNHSRLCEVHFAPEMWEKTKVDGKRMLKWNAVPTIFKNNKGFTTRVKQPFVDTPIIPQPVQPLVVDTPIIPQPIHPLEFIKIEPEDPYYSTTQQEESIISHQHSYALSRPFLSTASNNLAAQQPTDPLEIVTTAEQQRSSTEKKQEIPVNDNQDLSTLSSPASSARSLSPLITDKYVQKKLGAYETNYRKLLMKTRKNQTQIRSLKRQIKLASNNKDYLLKDLFNEDQILALRRKSTKFMKWSNSTLLKAFKLKFSCGTSGYEEILRQNIPLPSLHTLNRKLQGICFESGILNDIFTFLKLKVDNFSDEREKDCALLLDEMAITPGSIYDSGLKKHLVSITLPRHSGIATNALVIMLAGIMTNWNQTVAYYFISNSIEAEVYREILFTIITELEKLSLNVLSITSNMGESSQELWKHWQISAEKYSKIRNYIQHPLHPEKKIYILADTPNIFTNMKSMLMKTGIIKLSKEVQNLNNLPTNIVSAQHIHDLFSYEKVIELHLIPKSTEEDLTPASFQKTKSALKSGNDISTGLRFLSQKLHKPEFETTAWFLETLKKWFHLLSSKPSPFALTKTKIEEYETSIEFLKATMNTIFSITIGDNEEAFLTSLQTRFLVSTQSILDLQTELLGIKKYNFLLTSRFTLECIENLFNEIKSRHSVVNAQEFKENLKLITVSEYLKDDPKSSFQEEDGEEVLTES